jgi:hypothetical protein
MGRRGGGWPGTCGYYKWTKTESAGATRIAPQQPDSTICEGVIGEAELRRASAVVDNLTRILKGQQ